MKIDDSQKKQFIVLCALVVFVFAFGAYRMIGGRTSAAPTTKTQQETEQSSQAEQSDNTASQVDVETGQIAMDITQGARDPFIPQMTNQPPVDQQPAPRSANSSPMVKGSGSPFPFMDIPPLPLPEIKVSGNSIPDTTVKVVEAPAPQLRVTGVIDGTIRVAIIRGTANERYIVKEGDKIEGKYTVESISRAAVCIRFNGRKFLLQLGGNDATPEGARA